MPDEILPKSINMTRESEGVYTVTTASGATLTFGRGEGLVSPVELMLAAIAGCSSIDVDMMTSRRAEPERFDVTVTAEQVKNETGNILRDIQAVFDLAFPEGDDGDKARARVTTALHASHERFCTVSRTIEAGVPVSLVEKV
ncbi:OsmC family protein [Demequina capsici]|uniref:OsmC family protein n=1 Tax=Demequina capsici TaxID=3075620 RepID=A0AA96JAF1_9MICO|nr:OsmC family protein [Demequina sp. OYTSA14]WNM24616.1 OsmC family protein [Demequina sp. OYTSA14]